ncbi:hypothetical protein BKA24_001150 [Microbacterium marinum]|uniref:Uncharacterized protein n=1 Tax=Microbacterium marinum TaxID=421115 RepID=A0A7W7FHI6_9MICO|nr:hypothetical protein [Microbacterium marinum]MBB4666441.1 hypothetical protein [Microbacterium marinum]
MTQNSRRRSGSRPFDVGLRKSEQEARQRRRDAAEEARNRTPEQQATFERQLLEAAALMREGASKKKLAELSRKFQQERDADAAAASESDLNGEAPR